MPAIRHTLMRRFLLPALVLLLASACQAADRGQPQSSARPGINDSYLSEGLDTGRMTMRFEDEGREAYARRLDVMKVLDLKPGDAVADIGAGSGFFVELMAQAVGEAGAVYAVEIAPNWIEHLQDLVRDKGLQQVKVVEGGERSVRLPEGAIDLAFSSDTYHHFEYPAQTLASIHAALRPGGRWVVLDYDRIPGVSSSWLLEHLRLDKAQAIAEITAAGFVMEREVDIGLHENYLIIFRRP
jgi:predicted methyltransferase